MSGKSGSRRTPLLDTQRVMNKPKKGIPRSLGLGNARGGAKTPTADRRLLPGSDECPSVSFRFADRVHSGSWTWMSGDESHEVLDFLCSIGNLTWSEIKGQMTGGKSGRHKKHHHHEFSSLCKEAQDRLAELKHDERFEDLFRFRLGGKKRLWGFLLGNVFYVLWWDSEHQVYPTGA
jgi:hypothetical protein